MLKTASLILLLAVAGCSGFGPLTYTPTDPCAITPQSVPCQMERYTGTP